MGKELATKSATDDVSKHCKGCDRVLGRDQFWVCRQFKDGLQSRCKSCQKSWHDANKEQKAAYDRERRKQESVQEVHKASNAAYRATPKGKVSHRAAALRHSEKHPDHVSARWALGNAIKAGKVARGSCSVCGTDQGVEAHHPDYSKPFDVIWLCGDHHRSHHTAIKNCQHCWVDAVPTLGSDGKPTSSHVCRDCQAIGLTCETCEGFGVIDDMDECPDCDTACVIPIKNEGADGNSECVDACKRAGRAVKLALAALTA